MQKMKITSLALVAALAAGATGCVVRAQGRVSTPAYVEVDEEPPAPRVWITDSRPGYVYIQGRWTRHSGRWDWNDGHWERERANQGWVDGRWERRGNRHVYVEGRWEARQGRPVQTNPGSSGGVEVRDHRRDNPPPPPDNSGPVIRDHRR